MKTMLKMNFGYCWHCSMYDCMTSIFGVSVEYNVFYVFFVRIYNNNYHRGEFKSDKYSHMFEHFDKTLVEISTKILNNTK